MVILLLPGWDQYKVDGNNPVWYSFYKDNRKDDLQIIKKMVTRLQKNALRHAVRKVHFYERGQLIADLDFTL
ncbi:hypothetical protein [Cochleicola gelatinilyticus]|uniref:Uncharacterized protein n=1 Tax=Cochleicola gelatinilyticus TaxID=1763537 RepID=A0A167IK16_9FLAO|nr:hypothetical protein [Cochleicola gelatinilyticus]OAB79735.1 hypothetical protein ULVI_03040 [Cochleicola gelatinilyticus]